MKGRIKSKKHIMKGRTKSKRRTKSKGRTMKGGCNCNTIKNPIQV